MQTISFVHTADLHLGEPIKGWKWTKEEVWVRQEEHIHTFKRIISLVKDRSIPFLFIAGDFLEHGFVPPSLYQMVIDQFQRIPETHIFISPGNHDPYRADSIYMQEKWPKHVRIFSSEWESVSFPEYELRLFGRGFADFAERQASLPSQKNDALHSIYIMHGDYQEDNSIYFPINESELVTHQVDYVALGHIHKRGTYHLKNQKRTVVHYPGSPEARNWKEIGERTVTIGILDSRGLSLEWEPIHTRSYEQLEVDVTNCVRREEVIEQINQIVGAKFTTSYVLVRLVGRCSLSIDDPVWLKAIERELAHQYKWLVLEDHTAPEYDLSSMRDQDNLAGTFIDLMEQKMAEEQDPERQKMFRMALYLGLDAIRKAVV
jgi:exonuclease SbcD